MATNSLSRFQKRRKMKNSMTIYKDVDEQLVSELLNSEVNQEKVDDVFISIQEHYDMSVSEEEAQEFLVQFKKDFNDERFNKLIHDCKKEVINSIVTPFGLGRVVAAYDKTGGNVDTIHNAREGVYATKEEQGAYNNRGNYDSDDYHKDKNFINLNRKHSQERKDGKSIDYMTGEKLDAHQSHDLDHIESGKEIANNSN